MLVTSLPEDGWDGDALVRLFSLDSACDETFLFPSELFDSELVVVDAGTDLKLN